MTNENNDVRVGLVRSALRGTLALLIGAVALLGAKRIAASGTFGASLSSAEIVQQDTTQLNAFLSRVRGVDSVVCNMVGRSLDNRFGGFSWGIYAWESLDTQSEELIHWINRAAVPAHMIPRLRRGLSDSDACVRRIAARFLGRAEVIDLSAQLPELTSSTPAVREAALLAVGHFERQSGLDDARRALRDSEASVRVAAAWALGMIEHSDAIPALTDALGDSESGVRAQAALALGQIENESAVPALVRLLESDRDPKVRRAAAAALGQISG